jgi:hypothetical protein
MKHTIYISLFAAITLGACSGEHAKPFTEEETLQQDSVDQLNQDEAFDELLNDSNSTQNDSISE